VLLIVAGLLVQALNHATAANPGFEYEHVVSMDPALGAHGYTSAQALTYLDTLTSRLRNLPGVESVSLASTLPFGNKTTTIGAVIDGRSIAIHANNIEPEFFRTMTIPLLRGRSLVPRDVHAIVISQSFAVAAWPGQDPLGKTFPAGDIKYTVVGVSGNARVTGLQDVDAVECYFLAEASDRPSMGILVKTSGPPEGLMPTLTSIAKAVDAKVLPEVLLMKSSFRQKLQGTQYSALSVSLLALVARLLACLGIVGLVAYSVSQRTKEIGIRMALGATPAHVLSIVLRQFSRPVVGGLVAGVGGAAALSQVLRRALFGVSHLDPVAYLAAIGVFAVTAALAALLPARRALRVDPLHALRCE
jgi:predicted permease